MFTLYNVCFSQTIQNGLFSRSQILTVKTIEVEWQVSWKVTSSLFLLQLTNSDKGSLDKMSQPFLCLEVLFLILLDVNFFVTWQDKASKDTFFVIYLIFQSNFGLKKNGWFKIEKCHTGGRGQKQCDKSVTYYLNGPEAKLVPKMFDPAPPQKKK